jgi:Cytochrome c554 and c-prime
VKGISLKSGPLVVAICLATMVILLGSLAQSTARKTSDLAALPAKISPQANSISLPTELRVHGSGWWPTKGEVPRGEYAGSNACYECHRTKAEEQARTAMFHTGSRAGDSKILLEHGLLTFQVGPYSYQLATAAGKSTLTVSNATDSISVDLLWAFGSGHMGQTYIYQKGEKFYESHVSFFAGPQNLDITPGQSRSIPLNLEAAVGRAMLPDESHKCFGCHTTASMTAKQFDPVHAFGGVGCEACHGPGSRHVATDGGAGLMFDPGRLGRVEYVDFCGACHRTWQDVVSGQMVAGGQFNVRFAPYRLQNSKCWVEGDARMACVACHDPHKPLVQVSSAYDVNCLRCHVTIADQKKSSDRSGRACPVATKDCVTCHMPKVEPPNLHSAFTDHWIRIAKPGSAYPE